MDSVHFSSDKQDFQTPQSELDFVRKVAPIGLDPFTAPDNPTRAYYYASKSPPWEANSGRYLCDDGYKLQWHSVCPFGHLVFANPEYGRNLGKFVDKVEHEAAYGVQIITLTPSRTDTDWWQRLATKATAGVFLRGRITFIDAATGEPCVAKVYKGVGKAKVWTGRLAPSPAPFPVFYGYFGPHPERFREVFGRRGRLL